mgnify:CR=1 FL=1
MLHTLCRQYDQKTVLLKSLEHIQFLQLRKDKGFTEEEKINVHSVFIGNPGTGKTTVAGMMGKLYKKMGLLTKGHVTEVDRVDLIGEYSELLSLPLFLKLQCLSLLFTEL